MKLHLSPDIPASRSALPENVAAPTIPGTCGLRSPGSSGKAVPNGSSSKMFPGTSASALRHGLHACGRPVQRGRSWCAAPAAADLHRGPHRRRRTGRAAAKPASRGPMANPGWISCITGQSRASSAQTRRSCRMGSDPRCTPRSRACSGLR